MDNKKNNFTYNFNLMKKTALPLVLFFISFGLFAQVNLNSGLAAYYPFDGDANDHSGNNNHGNIAGSPALTQDRDGVANHAYHFNGNGDYIWVKDNPTLRPAGDMTVSAWVYCEDFSSWNVVVSKRAVHDGSPWNSYILYAAGTAGSPQNWSFGVATSKTNVGFAEQSTAAQTGGWVHLTGIYEQQPASQGEGGGALKNLRLYVNCQLVKEETMSGNVYYTDSSLRIGMAIPGPSLQYFKGVIDEVRIYNRALNEQEVSALCTGQTQSVNIAKLVSEYKVYPNPSERELYIVGNKLDQLSVKLLDIAGKEILEGFSIENGKVDVSKLNAGIYFLQIENKQLNIFQTEKIIIK